MKTDRTTWKRRRLIVNKQFQQSYILLAVLAAILIYNALLVYAFVFYDPLLYAGFTFSQAFGIAVVELVIIALAAAHGLTTSKKLAGPVHGMLRVLQALDKGDFSARIAIRKGEYFSDVVQLVNHSLDGLEERIIDLKHTAAEMQQRLAAGENVSAHLATLQSQLDAFKTTSGEEARRYDAQPGSTAAEENSRPDKAAKLA